jgi:hypothetical protein
VGAMTSTQHSRKIHDQIHLFVFFVDCIAEGSVTIGVFVASVAAASVTAKQIQEQIGFIFPFLNTTNPPD